MDSAIRQQSCYVNLAWLAPNHTSSLPVRRRRWLLSEHSMTGLPRWTRSSCYTMADGGPPGELRIAHAEHGPRGGPGVLMMRGEPSWFRLYRALMKRLGDTGWRCLERDRAGFGRSGKPIDQDDGSYASYVDCMGLWFEGQKLRDITRSFRIGAG